jgi:N-methylhydantoinase A
MERVARAIIATADASMARALRRVSVERGVDPRDCTLVAFGGGGPLHGCGLAEQIGVNRVLVPPHAGVLSAVGLALARERREAMTSVMQRTDGPAASSLSGLLAGLAARLKAEKSWTRESTARARYVGQGHELDVPLDERTDLAACGAAFEATHETLFGYRLQRPVEVVSLRHAAAGTPRPIRFARSEDASPWQAQAPADTGGVLAKVVTGPISIALPDATLFVAPGWTATALDIGGWMLERSR